MKYFGRKVLAWGFVAAALVLMLVSLPVSAAGAVPVTVEVNRLNVRQGPGTNYPIRTALANGDTATAVGVDATGGWYQVQLSDGSTGWLSATYVQPAGDASVLPVVAAPARPAAALPAPRSTGGGHIVFQASSGGAIYVMNPNGSGLRQLTTGIDPALSPDGRQVAFTRWQGSDNGATGSVWVINVDGTGERQALGFVSQPKSPSWSPDGKQLVVQMQQGGTLQNTYTCIVNGRPQFQLPQPVPGATCREDLANPWWQLRVINVADGSYQDLPSTTHSFSPTWDPANANLVVFHGDKGLMAEDLAQKTAYPLGNDAAQRGPVFSPNGQKLALTYKQDNHWEIHVANANGSGDTRLTETPLKVIVDEELQGKQPVQWNNAAPAWSPNGSQIVFLTDRTGQWEIWVMNADGSNQHPLLGGSAAAGLQIQYNGVDERVLSWR